MNAEHLVEAIGNIDDKYILEYAEYIHQEKKKPMFRFNKWALAACIAAVLAAAALIIPALNKVNNVELIEKAHIFSSYEEFAAVVPNTQIIENLSSIEGVELKIYGVFKDVSMEDASEIENFSRFEILARKGDVLAANVFLSLNDTEGAQNHIIYSGLTNEAVIGGITVYYVYDSNGEYWDSVLVADQNYYNILYHSESEQEMLEFLKELLENR